MRPPSRRGSGNASHAAFLQCFGAKGAGPGAGGVITLSFRKGHNQDSRESWHGHKGGGFSGGRTPTGAEPGPREWTAMTVDRAGALKTKISEHTAIIGIIGLGYVGLPLALTFCEKGFRVLGFDVDPSKVDALRRGESYIKHLDADAAEGRAARPGASTRRRTSRGSREPDAILICVPTPLTPQREPDMSYVVGDGAADRAAPPAPASSSSSSPRPIPGTTGRARPRNPRGDGGLRVRPRLLPRVLARARGSGQPRASRPRRSRRSSAASTRSRATSRRPCTTR